MVQQCRFAVPARILKPFRILAETQTPDGSRLCLIEHDGEFFLKLNGRQLMSTTATTSEIVLADLPCRRFGVRPEVRVLIGGLGLGFSLKRVLDLVGRDAEVHVAELLPEVVAWNREFLRGVNGKCLDDRRVKVFTDDVFAMIRRASSVYDAILLDVDNGPTSFVQTGNARIYSRRGLEAIGRALKPGGKVAFWSACEERGFVEQLGRAGFRATSVPAKSHTTAKRFAHVIYMAERDARPVQAEIPARRAQGRR